MLRKILPAIRPYVQVDAVARRRRSQTELERANARACQYGQEEGVSEGGRSDLDGKGGVEVGSVEVRERQKCARMTLCRR